MDKSAFKLIADNKNLFDLLKLALLSKFDIITTTDTKDDLILGQILRSSLTGKQKIEELFKEIEGYKTKAPEDIKINQAR